MRRVLVGALAAVTLMAVSDIQADELLRLNTRPGVNQPIAILTSPSPAPATIVLLFPGGTGNVGFQLKNGQAIPTGRFLFSDQRELLTRVDVVFAVTDLPSDRTGGLDRAFRQSRPHVSDMTAVVREIKTKYPKSRLVVLGHSAGTVSAMEVALVAGDQIDALVLMSSNNEVLGSIDVARLPPRVLMVNHAKDECAGSLFDASQAIAPSLPRIVVDGPRVVAPGGACGGGTHHWFVN